MYKISLFNCKLSPLSNYITTFNESRYAEKRTKWMGVFSWASKCLSALCAGGWGPIADFIQLSWHPARPWQKMKKQKNKQQHHRWLLGCNNSSEGSPDRPVRSLRPQSTGYGLVICVVYVLRIMIIVSWNRHSALDVSDPKPHCMW